MPVPLLDLGPQHEALAGELRAAFDRVLDSGAFILGSHVEGFEKALAAAIGVPHAIGVSSGTDALLVALAALGVGPGDEVITSPFTFFATAGCIARLGAKPVFVDIDPVSFNIDPAAIEPAVTPATRAIVPVHLYGLAADMDPIMRVAAARGLAVVEDAAQALGARCGDRQVCSIGDAGCTSFYPSKNLAGLGDGGAVLCSAGDLDRTVRRLRVHGSGDGVRHEQIGGNYRLDALQAALLAIKLPHLETWTRGRREHAARYDAELAELPLATPAAGAGFHHVYNQYTVRVGGGRRDALRDHLAQRGIGSRVYYEVPMHLQPCFEDQGVRRGALPHAERAADEVLSLPVYPEMAEPAQAEVVAAVRGFFEAGGR